MTEPLEATTRATRSVVLASLVGVAGAIGFVVVFAIGANTQLMGVALAVAMGGAGYALVALGHRLLPPGEEVEEREPMRDPAADRARAAEEFQGRVPGVARRRVIGGALASALGATGLAALVPLRSLGPRPGDALRRTAYARTPRPRLVTESGTPIHRDELPVGAFVTVYPEGHVGVADAQTVLIRLDPDRVALRPPTRTDWVVDGHIAYSKVCTHAGCSVGEYQVEYQSLLCPCHFSAFQVEQGGEPTMGPADRALPQLPLDVDDEGHLVAAGDFPEAVGPGWWTRP